MVAGGAEIVIRDKNSFRVYAGNLILQTNPRAFYSPDEAVSTLPETERKHE